jgi:hypothetical protein
MPLVAVNCAAPKYRKDHVKHPVSTEDCLNCAATRENPCHFTYELLASMFEQQQDRPLDMVSTTMLTTKCLRSEYLQRTEPFSEDPEKLWAAFRGTMYHGQLEYKAHPSSIAEARFKVELEGLGLLTGSPDLVDVVNGVQFDYKTNKENPKFAYPWGNHVEQLNVNRWLVDHATEVEWSGDTYDLTDPEVRAYFVPAEWTALVVVYMDDRGPKPLPCMKTIKVPKANPDDGLKSKRVPHIWSDEYAEEWIRTKYGDIRQAIDREELPPIPEAFEGWTHPLCGFCPKKKECIDLHYGVTTTQVSITPKAAPCG